MRATGIVESMKDFYWDIRPKPEYGTIELRVCDTPLTVDRAAAIACYLQAICAMLLDGSNPAPKDDDYLVYTFNRFQACRFGLDGVVVNPSTYDRVSIREDVVSTITRVKPYAERLQSLPAIQHILDIAIKSNNDATLLRGTYNRNGTVESVVRTAVSKMRGASSA
jgi:carboxylate-amine ligase